MAAMNALKDNEVVLYERVALSDGESVAAIVTLNRPESLNCFNEEVTSLLCKIFSELAKESKLDESSPLVCVILTGKGKAFCAGADLSNPPNPITQSTDLFYAVKRNPIHYMDQIMVPIIGAVHGYCITGGFELALACDILIGSSSTKFKDTHCKFNLAPCWGLSQKLQRLIGAGRAKWISLSAVTIPAEKALHWGLLTEIVRDKSVLERSIEMAETIAKNSTTMVRRYKRVIVEGGKMDLHHGLQRERELGLAHYIEVVQDGNTFEAAKGFIKDDNRARSRL